jgi:histone-lysine N-methyltransferase ASH1L
MARRKNSRPFPSSLTGSTSSFSYPSNSSLRSSVVPNLPPESVTSVLGQKQAGVASNEKDRDTKFPVNIPRRSLRRKSGPVSYNLALAPSVHGPSAGAKMAHEKAMRVRSKETLLDEVPKPPKSTPLRLLSNGGAEALNLDWEIGDCPGRIRPPGQREVPPSSR